MENMLIDIPYRNCWVPVFLPFFRIFFFFFFSAAEMNFLNVI